MELLQGNMQCAVISNARDYIPAPARTIYQATVYDPLAELGTLGITPRHLDLRDYFGRDRQLYDDLSQVGLVWVLGGNSFLLRRAMRQSGFDRVIFSLMKKDHLVYGGFSAGAAVAGNTLDGIHLMDKPDQTVSGYQNGVIWDGLSLYPCPIVPHYQSDHHESKAANLVADYLTRKGCTFTPLRDGEVVVVRQNQETVLR